MHVEISPLHLFENVYAIDILVNGLLIQLKTNKRKGLKFSAKRNKCTILANLIGNCFPKIYNHY